MTNQKNSSSGGESIGNTDKVKQVSAWSYQYLRMSYPEAVGIRRKGDLWVGTVFLDRGSEAREEGAATDGDAHGKSIADSGAYVANAAAHVASCNDGRFMEIRVHMDRGYWGSVGDVIVVRDKTEVGVMIWKGEELVADFSDKWAGKGIVTETVGFHVYFRLMSEQEERIFNAGWMHGRGV